MLGDLCQSALTKSLDSSNACSFLLRDDFKGSQIATDAFEVLCKHPLQCSQTEGAWRMCSCANANACLVGVQSGAS